jgi:hypothetical protein
MMKLLDEINDLGDIQRAAKCIIDRIERMLEFQESPDPYNTDASLFYEVYPVSDAEKRWWNELLRTLIDQDSCIEERVSVLKGDANYVHLKNAIKECDEQIHSLLAEGDHARDNFDREAYTAVETKLKIIRRASEAHHANLYQLESPAGGGAIKWKFVQRRDEVPSEEEIDALAVSFAEKCSLEDSECKSDETESKSSRVEIDPSGIDRAYSTITDSSKDGENTA